MIWCVAYLVWANRNKLVFERGRGLATNSFFEFQLQTFDWVTRRENELAMDWRSWLVDPFEG